MSEIEKMYENAGIKADHYHCEGCEYDYEDICPDDCPNGQVIYPPFTAEKQIELIKWLALTRPVHINKLINGWTIEGLVRNNKYYDNFENAISGYINSIYLFLDEHQRAEIKEILE